MTKSDTGVTSMPSPTNRPIYRPIHSVPRTLLENCTTYLDEQLYSQGFGTLSSILLAGTDSGAPILLPPAQYLSFAATLAVHPAFTTRTTNTDKHLASRTAIRYLRDVVRCVQPTTSHLGDAFTFTGSGKGNRDRDSRARSRLRRPSSRIGNDDNPTPDEGLLHSPYANELSLFASADDFWAVVGWAFNCATLHLGRWKIWQGWFDIMVDALERDLRERSEEEAADPKSSLLPKSLLYRYVYGNEGHHRQSMTQLRRVLRAIFADGRSSKSIAEFTEIWRNETRPPKEKKANTETSSRKRRKLDIENDEFADYFDEDDSDRDESPVKDPSSSFPIDEEDELVGVDGDRKKDGEDESNDESSNSSDTDRSHLGGPACLRLRQRLLSMILELTQKAPSISIDIDELLTLISEQIRPLNILDFLSFVLPCTRYLDEDMQTSLNEMLFRPIIAAEAPLNPEWEVTASAFAKHYAPYPASSVSAVENAKASLLVESMLRGLWRDDALSGDQVDTVATAVEKGIAARAQKVKHGSRAALKAGKKPLKDDAAAKKMMDQSAARMQALLAIIQE